MQSNSDGSYDFGFLFDNGAGITGETDVNVLAPIGTPAVYASDGITILTAAVPAESGSHPSNYWASMVSGAEVQSSSHHIWIKNVEISYIWSTGRSIMKLPPPSLFLDQIGNYINRL